MKIESKSFKHNAIMPNALLKDGDNKSPHLKWSDFPEGTKSFAILGHDPDAPTQSGFWHWMVINIPVNVTEIEEGASLNLKDMLEINNDADMEGYYGPQPPKGHGIHRYNFTVVALDVEHLDRTKVQSKAYTSFMIWGHTLASATITGLYEEK